MSTRTARVLFGGLLGLAVAALFAGSDAQAVAADKLVFELYKDNAGEFRWRLKDGDTTMATSGQGYKAKADARNGIDRIKKDAAGDKLTFEVYEDAKKEFRWRLKAGNGQVIATSGQGYKDKRDCKKGVETIMTGAATATVEEVTEK